MAESNCSEIRTYDTPIRVNGRTLTSRFTLYDVGGQLGYWPFRSSHAESINTRNIRVDSVSAEEIGDIIAHMLNIKIKPRVPIKGKQITDENSGLITLILGGISAYNTRASTNLSF